MGDCNVGLHYSNLVVFLLLLLCTSTPSVALYVAEGSNCTSACASSLTGYTTDKSDVTCYDGNYNSTSTGVLFQDCVSCELQSQSADSRTGQTDLGWAFCKQ